MARLPSIPVARLVALLTVSAAAALGCGDSLGQSEGFAVDSWANPTEHGELDFRYASRAVFTDAERYHGWTFTLSGAADVELVTELYETNLDTVLYLYRRSSPSESWGSYIAKNDDFEDALASRIERTLEAGEYFVKVRAKKVQLRGEFALRGRCEGDGCPVYAGEICEPESTFTLPAEVALNGACGEAFLQTLVAPVVGGFSGWLEAGQRCDQGTPAAKGFDYYGQYWERIGYDPLQDWAGEALSLEIDHSARDNGGSVVAVSAGGDEDTLLFVLDAGEQLVGYYWSNQSPLHGWTCDHYAGDAQDDVDTECIGQAVYHFQHQSSDEKAIEGSLSANGAAEEYANGESEGLHAVAPAFPRFAQRAGIGPDEPIDYQLTHWTSGSVVASVLTLRHGDLEIQHYLQREYDYGEHFTLLVGEREGDQTTLSCDPLWL
jgi:hypothetical protein